MSKVKSWLDDLIHECMEEVCEEIAAGETPTPEPEQEPAEDKRIKRLENSCRKWERKYKQLLEDYTELKSRTRIVEVVKTIPDTKESEALYEELRVLREQLSVLSEKVAVYETTTPADVYQKKVEDYRKIVEAFDISQYKILMVTSTDYPRELPFDCVDITGNPKAIRRCAYVDFVLVDVNYIRHTDYYNVKMFCKQNGVQLIHVNCRNKDVILSEVKRQVMRII